MNDVYSVFEGLIGDVSARETAKRYRGVSEILGASDEDLMSIDGMTRSKVRVVRSTVKAAKMLAEGRVDTDRPVLDHPQAVHDFIAAKFIDDVAEKLVVISLNTRRRPIKVRVVATGLLDQILIHAREVFRGAIMDNAHGIILAHNHPSGDPSPSEADIKVTRDMTRAGHLLKIELLDHLICGAKTETRVKAYASLRELGYMQV